MELARLDLSLRRMDEAASVVAASSTRVLISCDGASTAVAAAWLGTVLAGPVGVWLRVGPDYSAALAARDVATLAHLLELSDAVIEGAAPPSEAELVRALLTEDEVDFSNAAGTLRGAYNRPAPPRPVSVWAGDGDVVRGPGIDLVRTGAVETAAGTLTTFSG